MNENDKRKLKYFIDALAYKKNDYYGLITDFKNLEITYTKLNHLDIFIEKIEDLSDEHLENANCNIKLLINNYKNKDILLDDEKNEEITFALNTLFNQSNEDNLITFEKIITDELKSRKNISLQKKLNNKITMLIIWNIFITFFLILSIVTMSSLASLAGY